VKRVTGITLVDNKFLVCRGLGERYSNALLNGATMPNPVVEKKVAPLDLFPSGLIGSVVAQKTATPDIPGDFAGCSVNLVTKDFPENRLLELTVGSRGNSQATFQMLPFAPTSGSDLLGIDGGGRNGPTIPYANLPVAEQKPLLQAYPEVVWNPLARHIGPGEDIAGTFGDQWAVGSSTVGAVASMTYRHSIGFTPERITNIYYLGQAGAEKVDWGGIANVSLKLGVRNKFSWKNLYTRSADQTTISGQGTEGVDYKIGYQVDWVERFLWQTQLTGEHALGSTNLAWNATYGRGHIHDPDNHYAEYRTTLEPGAGTSAVATRQVSELTDLTRSAQLDWSVPLSLRRPGDALFKFGGGYRAKHRDYDGRGMTIARDGQAAPTSGVDGYIETLPPEQVFATENMGNYFSYVAYGTPNDPFVADDNVGHGYVMLDAPVLSRVRLVGGLRVEQWHLRLEPGGANPQGDFLKYGTVYARDHLDPLWSANLTVALSDRMNLRLAAYRTLARPDSREVAPGQYTSLLGFGNCTQQGDTTLDRSLITNGDIRWELYPRPGEIVAVSGFYKHFTDPIVELRSVGGFNSVSSICTITNQPSAQVLGAELDLRKLVGRFAFGTNLTVVESSIQFSADDGLMARRFIGQSPFVANVYLAYEPPTSPLNVSLLFNYFGERIKLYSNKSNPNAPPAPNPNWVEQGRGTLDAKLRWLFSNRLKFSATATNLTNAPVVVAEDSGDLRTVERYNPGVTVAAALTYAF
jgi:TonB-dependent receptor